MPWRFIFGLLSGAALLAAAATWQDEIEKWKQARETSLRKNWLQVAGLFWLHEGSNTFGRDPANDIVRPDGPARAGSVDLRGGKVSVTMDGSTRSLAYNSAGAVNVGRLSLFVIKRGEKIGIRLKDPQSKYVREFHGLDYFPLNEHFRVSARWVAEPRQIPILNVLGQTEPSDCPGYAIFHIGGREFRLYPIIEAPGDKQLFYIFRDQTAGKETYGAGRFLYSAMPKDGTVMLDFNRAYNPPCAFTDYATCPLPPKENRLDVRIEAGEKKYGH
jgi:uncharacterized protein (DUF1684 family)